MIGINPPSPLPSGEVNIEYYVTLIASDGKPPYAWSIIAGTLPVGLTLQPTGIISGRPSAAGQYTFTIRVTDSVGATATRTYSLTIVPAPSITTSSPLPGGKTGTAYSQSLTVTGGTAPYKWSIIVALTNPKIKNRLPKNLRLNQNTGEISGTPAESGTFSPTFSVKDGQGNSAQKKLSLTVLKPFPGAGHFIP
jgi:large repetitive protein